MEMKNLVTKLLGPSEEVGTGCGSPDHGHRWVIFGNQHFKVYLHHSHNEACSIELGPYPERLISIGLAKSYTRKSSDALEVQGDQEAWMVLIAKPAHSPENLPYA
jgi:hypothetical protein